PEGPSSANSSPFSTFSETSSTAAVAPNRFETPAISSSTILVERLRRGDKPLSALQGGEGEALPQRIGDALARQARALLAPKGAMGGGGGRAPVLWIPTPHP